VRASSGGVLSTKAEKNPKREGGEWLPGIRVLQRGVRGLAKENGGGLVDHGGGWGFCSLRRGGTDYEGELVGGERRDGR